MTFEQLLARIQLGEDGAVERSGRISGRWPEYRPIDEAELLLTTFVANGAAGSGEA